jgi:hypothetical protein
LARSKYLVDRLTRKIPDSRQQGRKLPPLSAKPGNLDKTRESLISRASQASSRIAVKPKLKVNESQENIDAEYKSKD